MNPLTERQQFILSRVIDTHIDTAQPVGSRTVRDRYGIDYSSTTVRYEMGVLEALGFLEQPHTSSGRIPTDLGYRYYVDHALTGTDLPEDLEEEGIAKKLHESADQPDILSEEASRLLSALSAEAGIVYIADADSKNTKGEVRNRLSVHGSSHLLEKPEFNNVAKLRSLFRILEEKGNLIDWMIRQDTLNHVLIRIGQENEAEALQDCSLVLTRYVSLDESFCAVAVLGPRRMRYRRTVPLVECMARTLSRLLNEGSCGAR